VPLTCLVGSLEGCGAWLATGGGGVGVVDGCVVGASLAHGDVDAVTFWRPERFPAASYPSTASLYVLPQLSPVSVRPGVGVVPTEASFA
jgi:hypothetical protein